MLPRPTRVPGAGLMSHTDRPVGSVDQPYAYTIDTTVADRERADGRELREAGVGSAVLGKADTGTGR